MNRPVMIETCDPKNGWASRARRRAARHLRPFARDEDGAMIIFGIMIFGLMLAIGGLSFDLMRYEAHRERLQSTLDRAVLAAASLSQTLPPTQVVLDYFAKAGMSDYISAGDITVTEGVNSRKVEATARIHVPLHHGTLSVFTGEGSTDTTLVALAASTAEESIGNVEISMVLDVSGSMNRYSRLTNLKSAARDFLDAIYDSAEQDAVSTSIVPYATQVNAGSTLLSHYNRDDSHEYSHCVNFVGSDFNSPALPTTQTLQQSVHFDPWTNENGGFDLAETQPYPLCPIDADKDGDTDREIMLWSTDKDALKAYVSNLSATGNTSTDVGTKWGAALLDPSTRPILSDMIASGTAQSELSGRPFNYNAGDSMKILVVMTDGAHTSQYFMDDFRSGPSFVWRYQDPGTGYIHYSIWYDGANSAPITDPSGSYTYCSNWSGGSCDNWDTGSNPDFWFHAWNPNQNYNNYEWLSRPYDSDPNDGINEAVQMDWSDVWAEIPPEYFSDEVLWEMDSLSSSQRNAYEYAISYVGSSTKNTRFDNICAAVKDQDVIIFTIGLEVTTSNAQRLSNCASTPSHYYDVDGLDIGYAFQSIASQINQLRLTQ